MKTNFITPDYLYRKFRSLVYLLITVLIFPFQSIKFKKANLKIDKSISRITVIKKLIYEILYLLKKRYNYKVNKKERKASIFIV